MKNITKQSIYFVVILAVLIVAGPGKRTVTADTDFDAALKAVQEEQVKLNSQLQAIEDKITQYKKDLAAVKGQKNTLQNKLKSLVAQQDELKLEIEETDMQGRILSLQVQVTENDISDAGDRIDLLRNGMGIFLRLIQQNDQVSLFDMLLKNGDINGVVVEAQNYSKVTENLSATLAETRQLQRTLNDQADQLAEEQEGIRHLLAIRQLQEDDLASLVQEQNTLVIETKNRESAYQASLNDTQAQARAIRSRLYELLDVEDQINFGQAVQIAVWASGQTGVRPAFLLSVLTQESSLGKNVGTCNRAGDPPSKSWKKIMHPTRDQPAFLEITKELGIDPDTTPLSCPMHDQNGKQIGWGGAMGPAQFIPSTWLGYKDKVSAITGQSADPWDIRDAFLAAAIKLAHDGATTKDGEWAAAMRYFSGSTNTKYRFYGDSVVARADEYQKDIDDLNKGS